LFPDDGSGSEYSPAQKRIHLMNVMTNSFLFRDLICRFQTPKPTWLENLDRVTNL
jgi:hypothetical protein